MEATQTLPDIEELRRFGSLTSPFWIFRVPVRARLGQFIA
jgi:hypothetical protein